MALKNFDISVNLYDDKAKISSGITVGDTVVFNAQILDKSGRPVDLTDVNLISVFVKKNDNSEYQDACYVADTTGACLTAITPEEGTISITLGGGATSTPGICYATISFYDSADSEKATTGRFAYYVKESTATDDFARVSEYKSLDNLIAVLGQYEGDLKQLKYYIGLYQGAMDDIESTDGIATLATLYANFVKNTVTIAGLPLNANISKSDLLTALGLGAQTNVSYPLSIAQGGTGATTAEGAKKNLGIVDFAGDTGGGDLAAKVDISARVYKTDSVKTATIDAWYYPAIGLVFFNAICLERAHIVAAGGNDIWFNVGAGYRPAYATALTVSLNGVTGDRTVTSVAGTGGGINITNVGKDLAAGTDVRISGVWRV